MTTFQNRLQEFKTLNLKRDFQKGYTQGLSNDDYNRLNSLHAFLLSSEEGKIQLAIINK
tara:strand:- start:337 stop:513 length:177 start_codon:yes stop_codon:yes gene_type:complete